MSSVDIKTNKCGSDAGSILDIKIWFSEIGILGVSKKIFVVIGLNIRIAFNEHHTKEIMDFWIIIIFNL